jgi:hypothetical protein
MQFKSNGSTRISASASAITSDVHVLVHARRSEIRTAIRALPVGGVASFATRNVADAGGKAAIYIERVA